MRILLAHNNMQVGGGADFFFLETGRVLEKLGHDVAYFSTLEADLTPNEWQDYFVKPVDYANGTLLERVFGIHKTIYSYSAKRKMTALLRKFKPDLVHVFAIYVKLTPSILDACRAEGVPVLMSCNDYKHICANYKLYHHGRLCDDCKRSRYYKPLMNLCAKDSLTISMVSTLEAYTHGLLDIYRKNVHTFLFASEFMARKTEEFWGTANFRWRLLRNPFNPLQYVVNTEPGDYALYFGRLVEEKGVDILIDAASKLSDIPVVIVGDGPDRSMLEKKVEELGLENISFVGAKWGEELSKIIQACRYVVVPSLWHENFPYVILQSFAHGKPVIGTNRGGVPEMVRHEERGLLYEATSSQELAHAMGMMHSDVDLVERMGISARSYVGAEFGDEIFYDTLMGIYQDALT